jgi:hypothetical protein
MTCAAQVHVPTFDSTHVDHIFQCILHDQFCGCEVSETKHNNNSTQWMCIDMIKIHMLGLITIT